MRGERPAQWFVSHLTLIAFFEFKTRKRPLANMLVLPAW